MQKKARQRKKKHRKIRNYDHAFNYNRKVRRAISKSLLQYGTHEFALFFTASASRGQTKATIMQLCNNTKV